MRGSQRTKVAAQSTLGVIATKGIITTKELTIMRDRSWLAVCVAIVTLATVLAVPCLAQPGRRLESPANRSLVTVVTIKPDMLDEWIDLQKNAVVPALKKAGVKTRTVYTGGIFSNAFEYTIIQPMSAFADFDSPAARAEALGGAPDPGLADRGLAAKLRKCVTSTSSFLSTALPDLSNPGEDKNPPIVGFLRLRVASGKMEEYTSLFRAEVLPALKQANSHVLVASRRLGTTGYDLTFETPLTKFADLDAPPPLVRALGPEGVARLTAKMNELATVAENTILIRQADLSF
jgi:hypothetical protein